MCISVEFLANVMTALTIVAWIGIPSFLAWWALKNLLNLD